MKILNYLKDVLLKRGIAVGFSLAAFVCSIVTYCIYQKAGVNEFVAELSSGVTALMVWSIVLSAIFTVFEVKLGKYATYMVMLAAWLSFITSQINYISNVLVAIDGNSWTSEFILTVVFGALAWIFMLVSAIIQRREIGSRGKKRIANNEKAQEATNE